jgi:small subunit ribosomal protein S17
MEKENKQTVEAKLDKKSVDPTTSVGEKKKIIRRRFKGVVVSNRMTKTVTVKIDRFKLHPVYGKRYRATTKLKAHDEKEQFKIGDPIEIVECRPMSKDKKWRVVYKKETK